MNNLDTNEFAMFVLYCSITGVFVWLLWLIATRLIDSHRRTLNEKSYESGYYVALLALQKGTLPSELLSKAAVGGPWPPAFDRGVRDAVGNHMGDKDLNILLKEAAIVAKEK